MTHRAIQRNTGSTTSLRRDVAGLLAIAACGLTAGGALAEDYFKGKQLRLYIGTPPGGGYDAYGRLVGRHIVNFIPGKPSIAITNMPGASGIKLANYLYSVAPRDGTAFAIFNKSMPFYERVGHAGIQYKSVDFNWVGILSQAPDVVSVWHTAGVSTIEDARKTEVIMGADSGGGTMTAYPMLLNSTVGTRFRIVPGYEGGNAVDLAMEKGEVQGRGSNPWETWKTTRPDWVKQRLVRPLVQVGLKKDEDLPDVPLLMELAKTEEQKQMFRLVSAPIAMERPFAAPPGIPAEARSILRDAFFAMTQDKAFLADAAKLNMGIDAQRGEAVEKIVADIIGTPDAVVQKVKQITTPDGGSSHGEK